jgi:hypothetical protein
LRAIDGAIVVVERLAVDVKSVAMVVVAVEARCGEMRRVEAG